MGGLVVVAIVVLLSAGALVAMRRREPEPGSAAWIARQARSISALCRVAHADLTAAGHDMTWAFADDGASNAGVCRRCGGACSVTGTPGGGAQADYGALAAEGGGFAVCPGER